MAIERPLLIKEQTSLPISYLQEEEMIKPIVKDRPTGKFVFLYDYETIIYTNEAKTIMAQSKGKFTLPANSSFNLKYSKGDVVDVVKLGVSMDGIGNQSIINDLKIIDVPKFVKPLCTSLTSYTENCPTPQSYSPTITIDNNLGWLQKVADNTPLTLKLGTNFGKNPNPATPVKLPPLETPTTDKPVITNGIQDTTETKSFFDDKNNLLMIAGVLLIGYLLLNDKSE
jgi:hypothetical protein